MLVDLLMVSVLVAGVMALGLVIYKRRFKETLRNIGTAVGIDGDVSYARARSFAG